MLLFVSLHGKEKEKEPLSCILFYAKMSEQEKMKSKTNSDKLHSLKQSQPVSFNSTANKASPTSETTKHTTFPTCT